MARGRPCGRFWPARPSVKIRWVKRSPNRSSERSMRRMSQRSRPDAEDHEPRLRPALVHGDAHGLHGLVQAQEDRLADEEMPDIELHDLRDRGDGPRRLEGEAVAGVNFEAEGRAMLGGRFAGVAVRGPRGRVAFGDDARTRCRYGVPPRARRGRAPPP